MFTGLVEEVGWIKGVQPGTKSTRLEVGGKVVLEGIRQGDSIATNGVCLTVTEIRAGSFFADVMPETLRMSNLGELVAGSSVNLERALAANGRFGGHIVTGHIDGTGKITRIQQEDNAIWIQIHCQTPLMPYFIQKGSVALDGTSLTIARLTDDGLEVSLIPHTTEHCTLATKKVGDIINVECDVVGKYVERLMMAQLVESPKKSRISQSFLAEHGFM